MRSLSGGGAAAALSAISACTSPSTCDLTELCCPARRASSIASLSSSISASLKRFLRPIEGCSHAPNICSKEFPGSFNRCQRAIGIGERRAGIDGHELRFRNGVGIGQASRFGTPRSENLSVGEEGLGGQAVALGHENVTVVGWNADAFQNH